MAHGAAKYRARDWEQGLSVSDLVRAADGHLWDWYLRRDDGKDAGPNGTGLSHLAHAACSILFLLSHELRGLPDDRPAPVPAVPQPTREGMPCQPTTMRSTRTRRNGCATSLPPAI